MVADTASTTVVADTASTIVVADTASTIVVADTASTTNRRVAEPEVPAAEAES